MTFTDYLRHRGIAQKTAAEQLGVTPATVSRLVAGHGASADRMRRIHRWSGGAVTPNDLVLPAPGAAAA